MSGRVLIVEDEVALAELLRDYFLHAGFAVDMLHRGDEVEAQLARRPAELLLLDLQLPVKDGLEVCKAVRARDADIAIMMVTARIDEIDRLLGLELGADDYVCKPFSPREVVARARAILRRARAVPAGDVLRVGALELQPDARRASAHGEELALTRIEFDLLAALMERPERIWSRSQLLERVRGTDLAAWERNIDSHVKNLRAKLRPRFPGKSPIRSVYGVGYGLEGSVLAGDAQVPGSD
ncbi:MAG: response regulator [Gammaproteobacteria bacterium]|nr:response regulator [Gammaproteobacteria bacterium]